MDIQETQDIDLWKIFWAYTNRYVKICFIYVPVAWLLFVLLVDYVPKQKTLSISQMAVYAIYYIYVIDSIVFMLYTFVRYLIARYGTYMDHQRTCTLWFHIPMVGGSFLLGAVILEYLRPWLMHGAIPFSKQFPNSFFALPVFVSLLCFFFAFVYYGSKFKEVRQSAMEAQYNTLKSQLQPHFLFNSLNSLSALIDTDTALAKEMTQKLGDLYREILENSKKPMASLTSEAQIVHNYLELVKVRFQERISFKLNLPQNADHIFMPSLLLQTLVENAVKHGIAKSLKGGVIYLDVTQEKGGYRFTLTNTGKRFDPNCEMGTGIANTIARLKIINGEEHGFSIAAHGVDGTIVKFFIPGGNDGRTN